MGKGPDYIGHRKRLRERFLKVGPDGLADYELLELLLFGAQPRRDVKPLAKALMQRFGSFSEVISADPQAMTEVPGIGESAVIALKSAQAAAQRLIGGKVLGRPVLSNWQALLDYCQTSMAFAKIEQFRILYLNNRNVLIADEMQQQGTVDHTPVYPREVVKRALELGATALIMVHNHPSGDPTPSRADIEMTRHVQEAGEKLGLTLHDHIIVSNGGHASFKEMGLL
ncbi:MAG: DNA repair protein RadC [Rhodospirillales bacterium]|nr:DNA repair protein RadC [Rhodospirillales bacterium]